MSEKNSDMLDVIDVDTADDKWLVVISMLRDVCERLDKITEQLERPAEPERVDKPAEPDKSGVWEMSLDDFILKINDETHHHINKRLFNVALSHGSKWTVRGFYNRGYQVPNVGGLTLLDFRNIVDAYISNGK